MGRSISAGREMEAHVEKVLGGEGGVQEQLIKKKKKRYFLSPFPHTKQSRIVRSCNHLLVWGGTDST